MNDTQSTTTRNILLAAVLILLVIAGYTLYKKYMPENENTQVACTMEALQCPDGSYVGRTGPNCEFAQCPAEDLSGWKETKDQPTGITFKYPETLGTSYIVTTDWPPKVELINEAYSCTEAGLETARAGITEKKMINGQEYCVTRESEGAAGSTYTNYAYASAHDNQTAIFTFGLRSVQCGNYDEPKKTECEQERQTFDINAVIAKIIRNSTIPSL